MSPRSIAKLAAKDSFWLPMRLLNETAQDAEDAGRARSKVHRASRGQSATTARRVTAQVVELQFGSG